MVNPWARKEFTNMALPEIFPELSSSADLLVPRLQFCFLRIHQRVCSWKILLVLF